MSGHLKHLGSGLSRNYLTPDDSGPPPTLAVAAVTTSPVTEVPENKSISFHWTVTVGGASQTNLVAVVKITSDLVNATQDLISDGVMSANEVGASGFSVVYDGIVSGFHQWTCTYSGTAAVGTYNIYAGSAWGAGGIGTVADDLYSVQQIDGTISATSTEVGASTPTSATISANIVDTATMTATIVETDGDPISTGVASTFTVNNQIAGDRNQTSLYVTITITPSGGAAFASPTNISSGSWGGGAWTHLGSGVYQAVWSRASVSGGLYGIPVDTTSFSYDVTPSATGTLTTTAVCSSTQVASHTSDTETTTVAPAITTDSTSGKYVPANSSEWTAFLSLAGITSGNPSHLYLLQEASGNAADSIGSTALPATSVAVYQDAVSGWTRDAIILAPESGDRRLNATGSPWPDKSTTSQMLLMIYMRYANSGGEWNAASLGGGGALVEVRITANQFLKLVATGASSLTGVVNYGTGVPIPVILQHDVTNGVQRLITHQEVLTPIFVAQSTANGLWLGAAGVNVASGGYLYAVEFEGAAAEMTRTKLKDLLTTQGWTVDWYPTNPCTLTKTGGTNGTYDAQAYSQTFAGDVEVEFTIGSSADAFCVGLSADNPDANFTGIDFGALSDVGTPMYQTENGSLTNRGNCATGDKFKITRVVSTGVVTCTKNGAVAWTFTGTSTAALRVDSSFRFTGDAAVNVKVTVNGVLQNTTWTTSGVTVS